MALTYAQFMVFHEEHPAVFREFVKLAFKMIAAGRRHYSARTIWSVMRYHRHVKTTDSAGFKLNNNYTPYYARLFHATYPEYDAFFSTRKANADE